MLTENELNAVKGLMHYLNHNLNDGVDLTADVNLVDSNGEVVGQLEKRNIEYFFVAASPDGSA